jgi:hypothetical protein
MAMGTWTLAFAKAFFNVFGISCCPISVNVPSTSNIAAA